MLAFVIGLKTRWLDCVAVWLGSFSFVFGPSPGAIDDPAAAGRRRFPREPGKMEGREASTRSSRSGERGSVATYSTVRSSLLDNGTIGYG